MAIQRRQQLLAAVEGTYAAATAVVAADAVLVIDDLSLEVVTDPAEVEPIDGLLDGFEHVPGTQLYTVSFTTPLKGSGAVAKDVPPEIGPLFKACGFSESVVVATSVTYALSSVFGAAATGYQSVNIQIEDGTLVFDIAGCYGTFTIDATVPTFPKIAWSLTGLYKKPTDAALTASPVYDASRPQPSRGLALSLHGKLADATFRPSAFTLDLNRETHVIRSLAEAFGIPAIDLGRCRPTGTFSAQERLIADKDWWGALETAALDAMSIVWGSTAGNTVTLVTGGGTGGMAINGLSRTDADGVLGLDATYTVSRNAGNDSIKLTFT